MSARDMREACAKGRDALASLWAAIGDRLCAGKPLDTAYAQRVAEECRAASRALEDVVPADDAVARARERWERASRRYFDARLALAAAYDLASLNVAEVGERAAAREAKDAYTALLAAERAAKGGEKEATQGTCSRCGYLAMPPACTKCYSPYPAPAPRDGGAKEGGRG